MAKPSVNRTGRRVGNVAVFKEGMAGGMKKFRCPLSQQMATPTVRADGTMVFRTPNGIEWTARKI